MADSGDEARSEDRPGGAPGSARPTGAGGPLARLFGTQLLAVLAITVVLTAIYVLVKAGDDTTTTALDRAPVAPTPSASPPAPASTTAAPPSSSAPATSAAPPSPTSAPPATTAATPTTAPDVNRPEVVVFNQSAPGGSGKNAAQHLRDRGWTVVKVDDFRGNVTTTTVYYPAGLEKAASRAARALPGDVRTREKFSNLSDTRLTVILTDDYRG